MSKEYGKKIGGDGMPTDDPDSEQISPCGVDNDGWPFKVLALLYKLFGVKDG